MIIEHPPLSRQLDMVFRALKDELASLAAGTIFLQIRNNLIGKFGVKHTPSAHESGFEAVGLSEQHLQTLRMISMNSIQRKRWTHGELQLRFALRNDGLRAKVLCESNYNMNHLSHLNLPDRWSQRRSYPNPFG